MISLQHIQDLYHRSMDQRHNVEVESPILVLSNGTNQHLSWIFCGMFIHHRLSLKPVFVDNIPLFWDAFAAKIIETNIDKVIILIDYAAIDVDLMTDPDSWSLIQSFFEEMSYFAAENSGCMILYNSLTPECSPVIRALSGDQATRNKVEKFNSLQCCLDRDNLYQIGRTTDNRDLFDYRLNALAFQVFSGKGYATFLDKACMILRASQGDSIRAIFVDLDYTLWDGVVGDDGVNDVLDRYKDRSSNSYLKLCKLLSKAAQIGILVSIVSKNEKKTVMKAVNDERFPIKIDDEIFSISASWDRKSLGISKILSDLNFAEEYCVFLDDNPVELSEVSEHFPNMNFIRVDHSDPELNHFDELGRLLDFQRVVSEVDKQRLKSLKATKLLHEIKHNQTDTIDLNQMGQRLGFHTDIRLIQSIPNRLCEMMNKTNQFNTTGEYKDNESLRSFLANKHQYIYEYSHSDNFADHGIIGYLLVLEDIDSVHIINWVESCRVFNRGIEELVIDRLRTDFPNKDIAIHFNETDRNLVALGMIKQFEKDGKCQILYKN